jgi:hypothetical protein
MAYDTIIKDYGNELYLTVTVTGEHKYSIREIINKIEQESNGWQIPAVSTISKWIHTVVDVSGKSWKDLWRSGQKTGYVDAVAVHDRRRDQEECIELHLDNSIREFAYVCA